MFVRRLRKLLWRSSKDALKFERRPMGAPPARGIDILHVNKQRARLDILLDRLANLIVRSWRRIF
jgi:hypothetical protein